MSPKPVVRLNGSCRATGKLGQDEMLPAVIPTQSPNAALIGTLKNGTTRRLIRVQLLPSLVGKVGVIWSLCATFVSSMRGPFSVM